MSLAGFSSASNNGSIYLVKCGEYYKIGLTSGSVESRVSSMRVGNPYPIEIIDSFLTNTLREDEARLHKALEKYLFQGEWFHLPKCLINSKSNWFKPSSEITDLQLYRRIKSSVSISLLSKSDDCVLTYKGWEKDCFNPDNYEVFTASLKLESEYAIKMLRENTCWAIEQATKKADTDTLLSIYRLLVDKEQPLCFKTNSSEKYKFCYRLFVTYKNKEKLWMEDWQEVLEFVVFHTFLSGEDDYSGTKFYKPIGIPSSPTT